MKKIIFTFILFVLLVLSKITNAQYIGRSKSNNQVKIDTLIDTVTGRKFILDKERVHITAINKRGRVIWCTDPVIDNKIKPYRDERPIIVYFAFVEKNKNVISIGYSNSMFGVLNKKNGKFGFLGQD